MRAAVIYAAKQPLVVEELTLDDPRRHEVRVGLRAAGVCHSDYHVVDGSWHGKDFPLPMVLGHEAAGVVEAVGPEVTRVKPGDHVILSFTVSCGHCRPCVNGEANLCNGLDSPVGTMPDGTRRIRKGNQEINIFGRMGGFAEQVIVHESQAIPMRPDMPFDRAALIGCATMTGVGAVLNTAKVQTGASVAVFGTGGVGLNVIQGAALVNAGTIIAVDLLDNKLELARMMGATHTINSRKDDPIQAIREITGGGADYTFDAIGLPRVSRQAYDAARRGGTAVVVGMAPTG
ncbi:MAG TPA: alcohol dehydrogenase catalytic domain-containing protein, partial [Chloroflexota bacterium]|nr:alcohol dehydrogenase catalytic domain-containing protein [Chloroflexota bacterium]